MYKNTLIERDKAIVLGDKELKKQSEKMYSHKCMMMIEALKCNSELLAKYKLNFESNENLFLEKYNLSKGKVVNNKKQFIDLINKQNIFDLFGIESIKGKIYKSNIVDMNIYKEIKFNDQYKENTIEEFLQMYNLDFRSGLVDIKTNEDIIKIVIKKESYHYVDIDNMKKIPYVYILENESSKEYIFKYSVFDIYCAIYNYSIGEAIKQLSKKLKISIKDIDIERQKYLDNIEFIEQYFNNYLDTNKLIKKSNEIIIVINKKILEKFELENSNDGYIPLDYGIIAKEVGSAISTITPYINLFCALGFMNKKELDNKKIKNSIKNDITSFYIPKYNNELLEHINSNAKKVNDKGIVKSDFTYENCVKVFGIEVADKVFQDKVTKNKLSNKTNGEIA